MSDQITNEVMKIDARVAMINEEIKVLDQENVSLGDQMAENAKKRTALRVEREGLSRLRESAAASVRIATHEEATAKARADAEKLTAELTAKNKEADELLAKLKDQAPKP